MNTSELECFQPVHVSVYNLFEKRYYSVMFIADFNKKFSKYNSSGQPVRCGIPGDEVAAASDDIRPSEFLCLASRELHRFF